MKNLQSGGFTLVELMIVVGIIAILTAVAMIPFNYYKNKARSKDLVGFARACVMEARVSCDTNPDADLSGLSACNFSGTGPHLTSVRVSGDGSCDSFTATAEGVTESGQTCSSLCTFETGEIYCSAPVCG
ncbi:type IV pilin protein [Thermodesulforhabdus norvegica]|uniref:Prepilin peptidase dependent protein D n=1 Tax=Thermodesulforhabdus norvegica TaxID=39841 RepID=A0A1I4U0L2_9BACT|nr:type II secretion system protein [Thermodesulforhabdus norvegica]SFM82425.1 prepilin peptidase dependent protein D [Thermodesulforhabdus norvegica]